jgi:DNA-binding transcriptional ArsR family regulator
MDTQSKELNLATLFSGYFVQMHSLFLRHPGITDRAKLLYGLLLSYYSPHTGFAEPSQKGLAAHLNLDPKTVRKYLSELMELGLIEPRRRGQGTNNAYYLPYYLPYKNSEREILHNQNETFSHSKTGEIPQESDQININDHDDQEDNLEKQWKKYIEEHQDTVRDPRAYIKKMLAKGEPPPQSAHTHARTRSNQPKTPLKGYTNKFEMPEATRQKIRDKIKRLNKQGET